MFVNPGGGSEEFIEHIVGWKVLEEGLAESCGLGAQEVGSRGFFGRHVLCDEVVERRGQCFRPMTYLAIVDQIATDMALRGLY